MRRREVAVHIGEICIRWADLERAVGGLVKLHLLPAAPPINHQLLMSEMQLSARVALARTLNFQWGRDEIKADMEACLNIIDKELRPQRNRYVHDTSWFLSSDRVLQHQAKARIVKPSAYQREIQAVSQRWVHPNHLKTFAAAIDATEGFVVTHINRTMHLRGDHVGVDPEKYVVEHVVKATQRLYDFARQKHLKALAEYRQALADYPENGSASAAR